MNFMYLNESVHSLTSIFQWTRPWPLSLVTNAHSVHLEHRNIYLFDGIEHNMTANNNGKN